MKKKSKIEKYTDQEALDYHNSGKSGKIEILSSKPMTSKRDLALAYSPGVAAPVKVIAEDGLIKDRPGFEVEFLTGDSSTKNMYSTSRHEVLMIMKGHWNLSWDGGNTVLGPGDTCSVPPSLEHKLFPANSQKSSLFRVTNTDDPAGSTWRG